MPKHGFETLTETDHRAWLWVASLLSLIYSALCLAARLTGKWDLLSYDDGILGVAHFFAVAHYGTLFRAIYGGLGVSNLILTSERFSTAAQLYFYSRVPYFIALCLSKASVLYFTRRIFSGDIHKENIFFGVAYGFATIYGICAVILSSANCRPEKALTLGTDAVARWIVITALDVCTEIVLLALPVWFISKNQINASKKRVVVFVFSFRLLVAALSIGTTVTYLKYLNGSNSNSNMGVAPTVVWQEILLCISLISASIPCLKSFLWAFKSTGLTTIIGNGLSSSGYSNGVESSQSRRPSAYRSHSECDPQAQGHEFLSRLRPDVHGYQVNVRSESMTKSDVRTQQCLNKKNDPGGIMRKASVESYGSQQRIHQTTEFAIKRS